MAEKNDNWFGSWLSAAKNKSSEVLEFVKKDLEEFGSIVKNEATNVVSNTGNAIGKTLKLDEPESTASTMKRSISSFLGQMNEVLSPSPDDSDTEAIMIMEGQETVTLTKIQQAVYELQKNEKTFTMDPEIALKKQYDCWLEIIDDHLTDQDRLAKHLHGSVTLKNQYTKLVPVTVDHGLFWKRYLFKKALLEDDIARQEAMEKREAKEMKMTEENVQWEKEDFANDIELTEEQQISLLEQYENETKEKTRKSLNPTSPVTKEPVGEKIVFQPETSPTKNKGAQRKNSKNKQASPEKNDSQSENLKNTPEIISTVKKTRQIMDTKDKMDDDGSDISEKKSEIEIINKESINGLPTNSSSNSSTDGEWEKISDSSDK